MCGAELGGRTDWRRHQVVDARCEATTAEPTVYRRRPGTVGANVQNLKESIAIASQILDSGGMCWCECSSG